MRIRKFVVTGLLLAAALACAPQLVSAKDQWLQVRSKNFFLIGNAPEKDIRKAATKLEQFRETFRLVFSKLNLTAPIPTNVVVFKSDSSYRQYKPKRADGKIDDMIAGYFQPGEDVNYITLSTEGTDADTYGTIFHEYVHFIIDINFGKSEVPAWFNEGLAEYYQTFEIEQDQNVKLGIPQGNHIGLLQQSELIPLNTLFRISNASLLQNGNHSRSIFYAQSWAMIHYLMQSGKVDSMGKFLKASLAGKTDEETFRQIFGVGFADMERDLRKYVGQRKYNYNIITLKNKLLFDNEITVNPLNEAESKGYLGDLLYRIHREEDAEPLLRSALALQPDLSMANTSLGMIKIRQRKYDEAKAFLEKAIANNSKNHLALYRYAYLISREGRDEFGYVSKFDPAAATKMRELLKRAIEADPTFTESYELLAFVSLVNNSDIDESITLMQQAIKYQPGNIRYVLRTAELYLRQQKFKEAEALVVRLSRTAEDPEVRKRIEELASQITQIRETVERFSDAQTTGGERRGGDRIIVAGAPGENRPTEEQIAKAKEEFQIRSINESLRPVEAGEKRVIGQINKIVCNDKVTFSISTGRETITLSSKDFQSLMITTFIATAGDTEVSCKSNLSQTAAVITYRPGTSGSTSSGELVALEFVPNDFRFIDTSKPAPIYITEGTSAAGSDLEEERRKMMLASIRQNLRVPAAGEKRMLGFIERLECSGKGIFFHMKVGEQVIKLTNLQQGALVIRGYTRDMENVRIGCSTKQVDLPVVFVYRDVVDSKTKTVGDLVSLEFVPKSFTLE